MASDHYSMPHIAIKKEADRNADWRASLAAFAVLVLWLLVAYRETVWAMVGIWARSGTYAHGFVVPFISLWLAWRQRHNLGGIVPMPGATAWVLMAGVALLWLAGDLVAVNAATQFSLVAMVVLAVPSVLGWKVAKALLFPLAFLFFAVPIGDFLLPQLMEWTADFTVLALRASGIPVFREGQQFVIPSGNWSVVEACSGIRYLIASITVGSLFAYLSYHTMQRRLIFVGVSVLVPIVANWLRAYMIVMLGHFSGNTIATGVDHLVYGWLFFGIIIMIMFLIGARWAQPDLMGRSQKLHVGRPVGYVKPNRLWLGLALMVLVTAVPHWVTYSLQNSQALSTPPQLMPLRPVDGWQLAAPWVEWKPAFENPSAESQQMFSSNGKTVGLYIGFYRNQNYEHKLVSSNNQLVTSKDLRWAQVASGRHVVDLDHNKLMVRTAFLQGRGIPGTTDEQRLAVWQFYWINGKWIADDYLAKIWGAVYRLMGRGDDSAVVLIYAPRAEAGSGPPALEVFVKSNIEAIDQLLRTTRGDR